MGLQDRFELVEKRVDFGDGEFGVVAVVEESLHLSIDLASLLVPDPVPRGLRLEGSHKCAHLELDVIGELFVGDVLLGEVFEHLVGY